MRIPTGMPSRPPIMPYSMLSSRRIRVTVFCVAPMLRKVPMTGRRSSVITFITAVKMKTLMVREKKLMRKKGMDFCLGVRGNLRFLHSFGDLKTVCQRCNNASFSAAAETPSAGAIRISLKPSVCPVRAASVSIGKKRGGASWPPPGKRYRKCDCGNL